MAAVEVPIQVGLANEAAKICLEPPSGPSTQPVLSIMFSMQIPIAALVAALLDFQNETCMFDYPEGTAKAKSCNKLLPLPQLYIEHTSYFHEKDFRA